MNQFSGGPDDPGPPPHGRPSFIADVNVGKLARWLRVLGYDTLFINPIDDGLLVEIALREGRIVLTRDTHIPERRLVTSGQVRVLVVEGDRVEEQLRFVERALGITASGMLSRCLECNVALEPVDRSEVAELVPPYVYRTQTRYHSCPSCGKIYWPGTHWERMRATARQMMSDE
ncbi:MAG TPA: Mut7-C RNAse domain-containing protein [Chloroflexota bacterium]|nr:Mut7-C RNAse domain-containing protein [Chloroflexota bacterium]